MEKEPIRNILPYGEKLRVLLAHTELSSSNHKQVLNRKGVFLSDYDKNNTVPALMQMILDPVEYQELIELQSTKENTLKSRTLQLHWSGTDDLLKTIPKNLNLNDLVKKSKTYKTHYKVIGSPQFKRVDGKKGKISLDFQIERQNNTKGWDERKTLHSGSLTIEHRNDGSIQLITKKTHTSKETLEVGEILLKELKDHYKKESLIGKESDFERILFNHFTNPNRILFFFSFTSDIGRSIEFQKLTNLTIGPDPTEEPHKDLKEFLRDIENLKIKGNALQSHVIIAKKDYHEKLIFSSLIARYRFLIAEGQGSFDVEYTFYDYEDKKDIKAEFQFNILRITLDKGYRNISNKNKIRKNLNDIIEEAKLKSYNELKS